MVAVPQGTEHVDIGPFTQGLIETINPWDVGDKALQECVNLDVMDDGVLRARRGIKRAIDANNWMDAQGAISGNQPIQVDTFADIEVSLDRLVFVSSTGAVNGGKWLYSKDPSAGWTELATTGSPVTSGELYRSSIVYNGTMYVPATTYSGIGFGGGKSLSLSALQSTIILATNSIALTAAAYLPKGEESFLIKDRMFVVSYDESKIYWSKATDPTNWTAPDGGFVLVGPKDGGSGITGCVLFRDILYIFKDTSIYRFSFTADPAVDGYLYKITDEFGGKPATDDVNIYFVNDRGAYVLQNDTPQSISNELNWRQPILTPTQQRTRDYRIFCIPGQVLINYAAGKEGFCYNTHTGTWSRYLYGPGTNVTFDGGGNPRWTREANGVVHYVTSTPFSSRVYYCRADHKSPHDYLNDKTVRIPRYRFKTKYYTFGERMSWKRFKKAWLDGWFDSPSSAGGANLLFAIDTNTAYSNELRTTVSEPAPGPLVNRWFKLGNRRFLSMAFIMDSSTADSYAPVAGTKDTLTDDYAYWFIRRIIMHVANKQMESV
jgi:hypothetical protein